MFREFTSCFMYKSEPPSSIKSSKHITLRLVHDYIFHLPSVRVKTIEKTTSITQATSFTFLGNSIPASCWLYCKNYKNSIFSIVWKARAQASPCLFDHSTYSALFPLLTLLFMFQTLVPVITLYTCSVPAKRIYSKLESNWFANDQLVN